MGRVSDARDRLLQAALDLIWTRSYGSVTVDDICERAGVRKGSFYHFFESKAALVGAALDAYSESGRAELDRIFSPVVPPLERVRRFFESVHAGQVAMRERVGRIVGCPFASIGSECSGSEPAIRCKIAGIMTTKTKYLESAIRDAAAEGSLRVDDVSATAQSLFAYLEGVLTQARIQDDAELIRRSADGALRMLGAPDQTAKATAGPR
jgi:TetR/AcrR family transcriptional repressor of nem operon